MEVCKKCGKDREKFVRFNTDWICEKCKDKLWNARKRYYANRPNPDDIFKSR